MARKTGQSRKAAASQGDGMVAELIDRVFENPASSGGLMVVALTATAIVSNAMFLQSGHHPDPLFSTRPAVTRSAAKPVAKPAPAVVERQAPAPLVLVPLPRPSPLRAAPAPAQPPPPSTVDVAAQVTTAIQRELARLGLYQGAIDGKQGPRTSAAISAYERAAGLAPTGLPTAALLEVMKRPLPAPMPRPQAVIDNATRTDSIAEAAALDQRERERAASIAAEQQNRAQILMQQNYRIVQGALNRIGYGPIAIDGQASAETADAIRRFELDNGLPIGGEATDDLIKRMIAIGAIKPT